MSASAVDSHAPASPRWPVFLGLVLLHLVWGGQFGPADGELLAWASLRFTAPYPAPFGVLAPLAPFIAVFGTEAWALRAPFAILAALPVLLVGRSPAAIALAAGLPVLAVPGGLATIAAPTAVIWLSSLRLATRAPVWSGILAGIGASLHPLAAFVALPAAVRSHRPVTILALAAAAAVPFVAGPLTTEAPLTGELSPTGLAVAVVALGGPMLALATLPVVARRGPGQPYAMAAIMGVVMVVVSGAPAPLLAGPLAAAILALAPEGGSLSRAAWPSVGVNAVMSVMIAGSLVFPLSPLPLDPRTRFVDTTVLADTVRSWNIPHVYAVKPSDIARLRWHGVAATTPPPVHPLDLPDQIALVLPQSADPDLPLFLGWDHRRDGPHAIVASLPTTPGSPDKPAAAWSLSIWTRPPSTP